MSPATTIEAPATTSPAYKSTAIVERETPLQLDVGLLAVFDPNAIDAEDYAKDPSAALLANARNSTQALLNAVFSLPVTRHPDHGPLASLPAPETALPREKSLPKPKPLTKWEKFAKAKGIQNTKTDKLVFDEETRTWVPRWGFKGANKKVEEQWIHEVPEGAGELLPLLS